MTDSSRASAVTPRLNVALWIVQVLVALGFAMAGSLKLTAPVEVLASTLAWSEGVPIALIRFNGAAECLGAVGLILPWMSRVKPALTPLAAAGLALVMLLAVAFHLMRGEFEALPLALVPGALAAFVAWGRSRT